MLNSGESGQQGLNQRIDRGVNEDDFIFCVINDVRNLLREQTNVQCVQDAARTRSRKVQLKVALRIPRKGADATSCRDSECI